MEDFKTESKYLKLCYEFRAITRCMKAAFYRQDFQNFLKTPRRAFETLSRTFETCGRAFERPRPAFTELLKF